MEITKDTLVVDTDFLIHFTESKIEPCDLCEDLKTIMKSLNKNAIMHCLVKKYELSHLNEQQKQIIDNMFNQNIILEVSLEDIHQNDSETKSYYIFLIEELYQVINGEKFPKSGQAVLTHWIHKKNLGEIHSIAVCLMYGCCIFLSDDGGSKDLAQYIITNYSHTINVYNRKNLMDLESIRQNIDRKTRRIIAHIIKQ